MTIQDVIMCHLDDARLMQVATVSGDQPWCATVYFAHDNAHNLYWISAPDSRHSQEIKTQSKVAGAIAPPQGHTDRPHGVQFEGVAREITDPTEIRTLIEAYAERYANFALADRIISGSSTNRLYQVRPTHFQLYDEQLFPEQPRQEWRPEQAV